MTQIRERQTNMADLTHTDAVRAASIDKLETQLAACSIDKSDPSGYVAKVDSAITHLWD
jgi:hypothetical protein